MVIVIAESQIEFAGRVTRKERGLTNYAKID